MQKTIFIKIDKKENTRMSELEQYRAKIDEIDRQLTKLFEERMNVVNNICQYKIDHGLPVVNQNREEEVVKKNIQHLTNKSYSNELTRFLMHTMEISKQIQYKKVRENKSKNNFSHNTNTVSSDVNHLKIGYYGVKGSFSEEAMLKYFGNVKLAKNYVEFEDVFDAIKNGEIDYGVVPIENSSTGTISQVLDLVNKKGLYINGEQVIKINQHLIGVEGATLENVTEVYSHPQGFEQTSEFLRNYRHWKLTPFHSTADSVKLVAELKDPTKAAIASERAAKIYNLNIIKENINNKTGNSTRFFIISRNLIANESCNKVSVVFSLEHKAGTLYHLLRHFAENDINMMKIESRPQEFGLWKYLLYVDFEGNIEDARVNKALGLISQGCEYFRLLGCYKQCETLD